MTDSRRIQSSLEQLLTLYDRGRIAREDLVEYLLVFASPEPRRRTAMVDVVQTLVTDAQEAEIQRLHDLGLMVEDQGEGHLKTQFGPGSYGMHELIDRAHVQVETWSDHVLDHPASILHADLYLEAYRLSAAMANFYQHAAAIDEDRGAQWQSPFPTISDPPSTGATLSGAP